MPIVIIDGSGPEHGPRLSINLNGSEGRRRWFVSIGDGVLANGTIAGGLSVNDAIVAIVTSRGVNIGSTFPSASCVCTKIEATPLGGTNAPTGVDAGTGGWCMVEATYGTPSWGAFRPRPAVETAYTEFLPGQGSVVVQREGTGTGFGYSVSGATFSGNEAINNGQGAAIDVATLGARVHTFRSLSDPIDIMAFMTSRVNTVNLNAIVLPAVQGAPSGNTYAVAAGLARMLAPSITYTATYREVVYELLLASREGQHCVEWSKEQTSGQIGTAVFTSRVYRRVDWGRATAGSWII
jgi:hypothetical protein